VSASAAALLIPVAIACGLGTGAGLCLAISGFRNPPPGPPSRGTAGMLAWLRRPGQSRRAAAALAAAVVTGLATGWPAGTVLAALAAWSAPSLLGRDRQAAAAIARIEAIAGWAEMLRDTVTAAAGLEQAITATAPLAPEPIRPQVTGLAGRLASGERLEPALRALAEDISDPLADLVVSALVHAAAHQARRLGDLLGSLAASARANAAMRLRTEAGRASVRTSARMIAAVTATMAIGLILLNRGYLAPYDTAAGQVVLLAAGAVFAGGFALLRRMAAGQQPARILTERLGPAEGD
jgi:tight adherence protein B